MGMVEGILSVLASFVASAEQTFAAFSSAVPPLGLSSFRPSLPLASFIFLQRQENAHQTRLSACQTCS